MKPINQIAQQHDVHRMQVRQWKRDIQAPPLSRGVHLLAAWCVLAGLEHGHHLCAAGARFCLIAGCDRLAHPAGDQLTNQL